MTDKYVHEMSSRYLKNGWDITENMSKTGTISIHVISGLYRHFPNFILLTDFDASKSVSGSFFAFFAKIWPKNMFRSSKLRSFFAWTFLPGDLRWPWPLLWSQSRVNDTYKCQRHYPCRLLLPPNRLRPSFFAIFFKRLDKNPRNFRSEHLRTCPNFHYLDILLSHKYFRHFPLTRNVNFQAADSLSE